MRLSITNDGKNDLPYMVVDGHGFLLDLSAVHGTMVDKTIYAVEWGLGVFSGEAREFGVITRQDGTKQTFFDFNLLKPYIDAWRAKKADLAAEQVAFEAKARADAELARQAAS
jgi:hypothetical protein